MSDNHPTVKIRLDDKPKRERGDFETESGTFVVPDHWRDPLTVALAQYVGDLKRKVEDTHDLVEKLAEAQLADRRWRKWFAVAFGVACSVGVFGDRVAKVYQTIVGAGVSP